MKKTYDNFRDAFNDMEKDIQNAIKPTVEAVAREIYKDSKEFTYLDTEDMYNSGQDSDFKGGYVVIKAPQVRWLYYTTSVRPRRNKNARVQWFEATDRKYRPKYNKILIDNIMREIK